MRALISQQFPLLARDLSLLSGSIISHSFTPSSIAMSAVNIIYGAGSAGSWPSEIDGPKVLDVLEEFGIKIIDTARIYGPSEELLGIRGAATRVSIDTKHPGGFARTTPATTENILAVAKISFDLLQTNQVCAICLIAGIRSQFFLG